MAWRQEIKPKYTSLGTSQHNKRTRFLHNLWDAYLWVLLACCLHCSKKRLNNYIFSGLVCVFCHHAVCIAARPQIHFSGLCHLSLQLRIWLRAWQHLFCSCWRGKPWTFSKLKGNVDIQISFSVGTGMTTKPTQHLFFSWCQRIEQALWSH